MILGGNGGSNNAPQAESGENGNDRAHEPQEAAHKLGEVDRRQLLSAPHAAKLLCERDPLVLDVPGDNGQRKQACEHAARP